MYDGHDGVSNHQPYDCLQIKDNISKVHVSGLCEGISPVTGEFPPQRTSNTENVSIWWRHHVPPLYLRTGGTEHPYPSTEYTPHPPTASEISWNAPQVSPQHKETQAMSIYLAIYRIALIWILNSFGRCIWLNVFVFVFESMYLYLYLHQSWRKYLYLYLKNPNFCICICICIW